VTHRDTSRHIERTKKHRENRETPRGDWNTATATNMKTDNEVSILGQGKGPWCKYCGVRLSPIFVAGTQQRLTDDQDVQCLDVFDA
jgi:hypothetical protein